MRSWLKALRTNANMNQTEAAKALGISRQYYSFIEKGLRLESLNVTLMVKISKAFHVTVNQIAKYETERIGA